MPYLTLVEAHAEPPHIEGRPGEVFEIIVKGTCFSPTPVYPAIRVGDEDWHIYGNPVKAGDTFTLRKTMQVTQPIEPGTLTIPIQLGHTDTPGGIVTLDAQTTVTVTVLGYKPVSLPSPYLRAAIVGAIAGGIVGYAKGGLKAVLPGIVLGGLAGGLSNKAADIILKRYRP